MKPIILKMTSFGPYVKETIDFTKLEGRELFLITGDTGSGKTTIFDAISVALYGETNGKERTVSSLRSDYQKAEEMMQLDLTFSIRDKVYRVVRVPKQLRKKQRGEGFTEEKGYAELYEINEDEERLIDTDRDVTEKVISVIGLNARQFRQIVMIPQGQFRKLITENSEEREKILKSIFDVHKYQIFQRKLEEQATTLKDEIVDVKKTMDIEVGHIVTRENEGLKGLIDAEDKNYQLILEKTKEVLIEDEKIIQEKENLLLQYKKDIKKIDEQITEIKAVNGLFEELDKVTGEKEELIVKRDSITALDNALKKAGKAQVIEGIEKNIREWELKVESVESNIRKVKEDGEILKTALETAYKDQVQLDEQKVAIEEKKAEKEKLNLLLPDVEQYHKAKDSYKLIRDQFENEKKKSADYKEKLNTITSKINVYQKEKVVNQKRALDLEKLRQILTRLMDMEKSVSDCRNYQQQLRENNTQLEKLEALSNAKKGELEQEEGVYDKLYKAFINGQAALIARELHEGDECPVCGQAVHHLVRREAGEIPTEAELSIQGKNVEGLKKAIEKYRRDRMVCKTNNDHLFKQIAEGETQLKSNRKVVIEETSRIKAFQQIRERVFNDTFISKEPEHFLKEIKGWIEDTKKQAENIYHMNKEELEHFSSYEKTIIEEEKTLERLNGEYNILEEKHKETISRKSALEETGKLLAAKIPEQFKKAEDIHIVIKKIVKEIDNYDTRQKQLSEKCSVLQQQSSRNKAIIDEKQKNLVEASVKKVELEREFTEQLLKQGFADQNDYTQSKKSARWIATGDEEVKRYHECVAINQAKISDLQVKTEGKEKEDIKKVTAQKESLEQVRQGVTEDIERIRLGHNRNEDQFNKLNKLLSDFHEKLEEHSIIDDLNRVANGARGTNRITFERFILSAFLEDIIKAANARFYKMTNARYELAPKFNAVDKRKHAGLDFEVYDYFTNKLRDVKTLSGGEGFKASLALALGVGDIAKAYAGGITIDTIFIDEGFGTLSSEYLDNAINCLLDLNEKGKFVGIISHVQELKERIDTQMIIEKGKEGSSIKFKL